MLVVASGGGSLGVKQIAFMEGVYDVPAGIALVAQVNNACNVTWNVSWKHNV